MLRSLALPRRSRGRPATLAAVLLTLAAPSAEALDFGSPHFATSGSKDYGDFGWCVATAGDVNGDGYSDLLVTEPFGDPDYLGTVYLYYGSPLGPASQTADWSSTGANTNDEYGWSASTAGDVNGDGYDDFVIGIPKSDALSANGGAFEIWYGSASGPQFGFQVGSGFAGSRFGHSVAYAGDVNGDGYDDIVVGAPDENGIGTARIYLGGAGGLQQIADAVLTGAQAGMDFGACVAGAGDVNADGYADVLVGADRNDSLLQTDNGRASLFLGSSSGVSTTSQWSALGIGTDTYFGRSVAGAGDLNGDGYGDVLIGEPGWDNGQTDEGCVHVYLGSSVGLASGVPPWKTLESDSAGAQLGHSVAVAGDFTGDGFPDLVGGGPLYGASQQGWVAAWKGGASGPVALDQATVPGAGGYGYSVAPAGDVNGDGFGDLVVGAPLSDGGGTDQGWIALYLGEAELPARASDGSPPWSIPFGTSSDVVITSAGDVNGDGYDDLLLGDPFFNQSMGAVFLHFGGEDSVSTAPDWALQGAAAGDELGHGVASAGDVNADGYDDVIVGAPGVDEAYVFHGSPTGLSGPVPDAVLTGTPGSEFGYSVCSAGDFDLVEDGYGDVIVGAPEFDGKGAIQIWLGSSTGVDPSSPLLTWYPMPSGSRYGASLAYLGRRGSSISQQDDTIAIAAPGHPNGGAVGLLSRCCAGYTYGTDFGTTGFGFRVAAAGDVDADGIADLLVSEDGPAPGEDGRVWLASAAAVVNAVELPNLTPTTQGSFGRAIAGVGDVDGDGRSDVIAGDLGATANGSVQLWSGPDNAGEPVAWQETLNLGFGAAVGGAGDLNGDGLGDFAVWDLLNQEIAVHYGGGYRPLDEGSSRIPRPLPRQMRTTGEPVALRGLAEPTAIRLQANAASPAGRVDVRMEVELAETDQPFGAPLLTAWQDPGAASGERPSVLLALEPASLTAETDYRWRMRIRSRHPFFPQSRWMSDQPAVPTLKHFRTAVHPATGVEIGVSEAAAGGGIRWIGPNPFRASSGIDFAVARRGPVRLDVVDVTGRRIATLVDRIRDAGRHRVTWDGRDEDGRPVAAGVYFVRLHAGGESAGRKVVRLR